MDQLFGVIEHVREHRLTYGSARGKVISESESIVFASDSKPQAEKECGRRQAYAKEHGGGGLMIREAEWMKLKHSSYRVEPIVAQPIR